MKSKPHTIRFEEKDFEFICKREGLKTAQSILNFLLKEYIKLYRVEKKSVFDVKEEPDENKDQQSKSLNYFEANKSPVINNVYTTHKKVKTIMDYVNDRIECDNQESYSKWLNELENDPNLTRKQKELAKTAQP